MKTKINFTDSFTSVYEKINKDLRFQLTNESYEFPPVTLQGLIKHIGFTDNPSLRPGWWYVKILSGHKFLHKEEFIVLSLEFYENKEEIMACIQFPSEITANRLTFGSLVQIGENFSSLKSLFP